MKDREREGNVDDGEDGSSEGIDKRTLVDIDNGITDDTEDIITRGTLLGTLKIYVKRFKEGTLFVSIVGVDGGS